MGKLAPQFVNDQFEYCLVHGLRGWPVRPVGQGFGDITIDDTIIVADGIMSSAVFDARRIGGCAEQIRELLAELPTPFMHDQGGGWSALNACVDRGGELWTGEHATVEKLVRGKLVDLHILHSLEKCPGLAEVDNHGEDGGRIRVDEQQSHTAPDRIPREGQETQRYQLRR